MREALSLRYVVRSVARQVRLRRAEYYGLRGACFGALAALAPLLLKEAIGPLGPTLALALIGLGIGAGALIGLCLPLPPYEAARLTDRTLGLQDRLATALEWGSRPARTPLVELLLADTAAQIKRLGEHRAVPRRWPKEAKLLPVPLVVAGVLALAPALPLPTGTLAGSPGTREESEAAPDRTGTLLAQERPRPEKKEAFKRVKPNPWDFSPRPGQTAETLPGDVSAIFKDTSLGTGRPDFASFLKKGDERIRMLGEVDRLPDLQRDFARSEYKVMFQKGRKLLSGGLNPSQISPDKLRELLQEMERLGRTEGNWSGEALEGMEALDMGQTDRALEAMQKALSKMRAMEQRGRRGKTLKGGPEGKRGAGTDRGWDGSEFDDLEFGEGLLPGTGPSRSPKGGPSERLPADPYDASVEGEPRPGQTEAFDTNLLGRGAKAPSRLGYLEVFPQYRTMMEEALAREEVPRDYRQQVKEYFRSLEER